MESSARGSRDVSKPPSWSGPLAGTIGALFGVLASGVAHGQGANSAPAASAAPPSSAGAIAGSAGSSAAPAAPGSAAEAAPSESAAPSGSAPGGAPSSSVAPPGSGSAEPAPSGAPSAATPDGSSEAGASIAPEPSGAPSGSASRVIAATPPEADEGRTEIDVRQSHVAFVEAGGFFSQGLDATDSATRAGGFYLGGIYPVAKDIVFTGRYQFASGYVVERLPGNRLGEFGVPNDVGVLETRHAVSFDIGYVARMTDGRVQAWLLPLIGPRIAVFKNAVAPRWAFEADLALRAGIWVGDLFEASSFIAYDPAIAKEEELADVQGPILSELRVGVGFRQTLPVGRRSRGTRFRPTEPGPVGVSIGYEGDILTLDHQRLSSHSIVLGLSYSLETK